MELKVEKAIQDEYPADFAWCYGCGRLNEDGHHFRTGWHENGKQTITIFTPDAAHTALPGFVYGGIIASLIDCHGTGSASLALHRKNGHKEGDGAEPPRFVTASFHVDFVKPTPHGVPLKAIGHVSEIHPKKWKVVAEVFANEQLCACGEVVAVLMPKTFFNKRVERFYYRLIDFVEGFIIIVETSQHGRIQGGNDRNGKSSYCLFDTRLY